MRRQKNGPPDQSGKSGSVREKDSDVLTKVSFWDLIPPHILTQEIATLRWWLNGKLLQKCAPRASKKILPA